MIVHIIKYGSPILRKHSSIVSKADNPEEMSANLFETVKKYQGVGLAAPQTGILKRIFVIDTSLLYENNEEFEKSEKAFLNPEIIWKSVNEVCFTEGCLSIPDIKQEIMRPEKIRVRYFDLSFNEIEEELDGVKSRIFQHEYDHLEGVLFIDRLSRLRKKFLATRLNELKNTKNNTLWIKTIQFPKFNYRTLKTLSWLYRAKAE
jgi:peptide deformylase